jgi:hypothetical protein
MKIIFDIFLASPEMARQNAMLQACDVFEPWKMLACHQKVQAEIDGDPQKMVDIIVNTVQQEGGYVVFVGTKMPDVQPHIMPGIRVLSNGKTWCTFNDALIRAGYTPIVDESMSVIGIKP